MADTISASAPSHPKTHGPMVEFFLGRSVRGVQIPGDGVPEQVVRINGYPYTVQFGKRNRVPEEVYQAFLDSRSRPIRSLDENAKLAPKTPENLGLNYSATRGMECDYEIELISKEGK